MLRPLVWLLGLALVLAAAWVHGLTATAGDSMATLYALWLFVPAPVVYLWQGVRPWRDPWRRLGQGYLGLSLALSLAVLGGVGWIGSERTIHPKPSTNEPTLEEYFLPVERIEFSAPDGTRRVGWFIPGSDPTPSDALAAGFTPQDGSNLASRRMRPSPASHRTDLSPHQGPPSSSLAATAAARPACSARQTSSTSAATTRSYSTSATAARARAMP